jgi:hypothetical protein
VTTETTLTYRPARWKGEMGCFPDTEMASQDMQVFRAYEELLATLSSPRTLQALKFLWALVHKAADNSDIWLDKDTAMEDLKLRAGFARPVYDPKTREMKIKPKSLKKVSEQTLRTLTDKIADIICVEVMPGMDRNRLYKEIAEMVEAHPR